MTGRNHEYLPFPVTQWIETGACLAQEALSTENWAELLWAIISHNPRGQVPQVNPVASSPQHSAEMP